METINPIIVGGSGGGGTQPIEVTFSGGDVWPDNIVTAKWNVPIGAYAAYNWGNLASVTLPDGVTSVGTFAFYHCSSLASVTLPDGVTSVGANAFSGCISLASITLPDGVTSIGNFAFSNCGSLASFTCLATTPPTILTNSFSNAKADMAIYVPADSVDAYKAATNWSDRADYIQAIPEG